MRVELALGPVPGIERLEDVAQSRRGKSGSESNAQENRKSNHLLSWSRFEPLGERPLSRWRERELSTGSRAEGAGLDVAELFECLQFSIDLASGERPEVADEDVGVTRQSIAIEGPDL